MFINPPQKVIEGKQMNHCVMDDGMRDTKKAIEDNQQFMVIHCPWCGSILTVLKGAKGRFKGSVGSSLLQYTCSDCNKNFNLLITGDDFFPDRGFGPIEGDFNFSWTNIFDH